MINNCLNLQLTGVISAWSLKKNNWGSELCMLSREHMYQIFYEMHLKKKGKNYITGHVIW